MAFVTFLFGACAAPPIATPPPPAVAPAVTPLPTELAGFPLPPHQRDAWIAPATPLGAATKALYAHGFADPRGLPYGEIEIAVGSVWSGDGGTIKVHGWAMPGDAFGVAWNGLVYPLRGFHAGADVATDMRAVIAQATAERDKWNTEHPDSPFHRFPSRAEPFGATHETVTATKVALLERLGDSELAANVWTELGGDGDPYLAIASEWAWWMFDRALTAHMKGDDKLAAAGTRPLVALRPVIEAEAARHGYTSPGEGATFLAFLAPLDALARDTDRRLAVAPHAPMPDLAKLDPDERVKALVDHLDDVNARQDGQPGGVDLASDPIVAALIAQGGVAVEPLLDVLERDTRLTRSVHFHRDFGTHRSLLGVHEAAYVALAGILETSFFSAVATGDDLSGRGMEIRKQLADEIRAYWDKWKNLPLAERWYKVLADDTAKPDDWVDAADKIARPNNVQVLPTSMVGQTTITTSAPSTGLRGDDLRHHVSPSVGELLDKRIHDPAVPLPHACALAGAFGRWDAKAADKILVETVARAIAASKGTEGNKAQWRCIVALTLQRTDAAALDDYAVWVRTTSPTRDDGWGIRLMFEPMWLHPTHKAIVAASDAVFRTGSPWVPVTAWERDELLDTELVKVHGFRAHVLAALADHTEVGTTSRTSDTRVDIDLTNVSSTSADPSKDPLAPAIGTKQAFRLADFYAWRLARRDGAPKLELYWPVAARDAAIAKTVAYISALK